MAFWNGMHQFLIKINIFDLNSGSKSVIFISKLLFLRENLLIFACKNASFGMKMADFEPEVRSKIARKWLEIGNFTLNCYFDWALTGNKS